MRRYYLTACLVSLALPGCHRRVTPAAAPVPAQAAPEAQPPPLKPHPAATRPQAPPPAVDAPMLKLGRALSSDQQRAYAASIDQHLANARRLLGSLAGRTLTAQQREAAVQVQNFILQTEKMRSSDLIGAGSLAERAELLAADLARSLK